MPSDPPKLRPPVVFPIAILVVVGFSIVSVTVGVSGLHHAESTYSDLVRFDSGDQTAVDVAAPGRRWVWVRHDDYASASPTRLTVRREGEAITVHSLSRDVTYQDTNSAVTAVWTFDANQPGEYMLTADSTIHSNQFLVGTGNPQAESQKAVRLIKLGAGGIVLAFGLVLTLAALRIRQTKQLAVANGHSDQPSRAPERRHGD